MSKVEITVTYATLTKNYDTFGKMENYVRLRSSNGGQVSEYKTKIVEGEKDKPIVWNETLVVPLAPNPNALFEFTVLDEDNTSDDICGVGLLKPDRCGVFSAYGVPQKFNIRLFNDKKEEITGQLHVTTRFV